MVLFGINMPDMPRLPSNCQPSTKKYLGAWIPGILLDFADRQGDIIYRNIEESRLAAIEGFQEAALDPIG